MITIENLSKSFGGRKKTPLISALKNVSLELRDGEITGLLGLNGAGKSTLMRLIYGLLQPTHGQVWIDGISVTRDADGARKRLGVLPDDTGLYKRLTARENIRYYGELQGLAGEKLEANINRLINWLGMENIADRPAEGFSLGERMKTSVARAIVHQPQHILLDEPTNGLDVITTRAVRRLLHELKAEGRSVLFSSHLMHEVSGLCDRVIIISGGEIVADGSVADIIAAGQAANLEEAFINLVQPASPAQFVDPVQF